MASKIFYSYKLKAEACEKGSAKGRQLVNITVNYLCVAQLRALLHYYIMLISRSDIATVHSSSLPTTS
jgi:hypothetical protein